MKRALLFTLLFLSSTPVFSQTQINVALASAGAVASASSSYNTGGIQFPAANAIQGDKSDWCGVGQSCGPPINGWAAANGSSVPQWLEVDFPVARTLSVINTIEIQDSPGSPGMPPVLGTTTCSAYCSTSFLVQTWDGSMWNTIPGGSITGNNKVWNQFTLVPTITTTKIRYYVTATNGSDGIVRFVDLEAYYTHPAGSVTFNAASCNRNDVAGVVGVALNGDTVNIPPGTCSWSTGVGVAAGAGITIMGAGSPTSNSSKFLPDSSCSGAGNTTLNVSNTTQVFGASPTFGASLLRFSCMTINSTSATALGLDVRGTCTLSGCPNLRVDNITWTGFDTAANHNGCSNSLNCVTNMFGVADHNNVVGSGHFLFFIDLSFGQFPDFFGGSSDFGIYGNRSWANPAYHGTNRFFFYENNTFVTVGTGENENDARFGSLGGGGRVVVRFNKFMNMVSVIRALAWHGTEAQQRAPRTYEFYGNYYQCSADGVTGCTGVSGLRDTTGYVWGNLIDVGTGALMSNFWDFTNFRTFGSLGTWGACDGSSAYDINDNVTYFTGGVICAFDGSNTVTISDNTGNCAASPGWTAHTQWPVGSNTPYSMHDIDGRPGDSTGSAGNGAEIWDNGTNTLVLSVATGGSPNDYQAVVGHRVQILRATACIDQMGYGKGFNYMSMLGVTPFTTIGGAVPFQSSAEASEPTYSWLNYFDQKTTCSGTCGINIGTSQRIRENREFYQETVNQAKQVSNTSPFNGTGVIGSAPGAGHGTKANIPMHCTPGTSGSGTSYWATDEGSWNSSSNTYADPDGVTTYSQGDLYLCTATDTWTLSYVPYTYPHPLDTGGVAPTPPPNVVGAPIQFPSPIIQ